MIICKTYEQQKKASKVKNLNGKGVEGFILGNNESIEVIYNVYFEISEEDWKNYLKGGKKAKAKSDKSKTFGEKAKRWWARKLCSNVDILGRYTTRKSYLRLYALELRSTKDA